MSEAEPVSTYHRYIQRRCGHCGEIVEVTRAHCYCGNCLHNAYLPPEECDCRVCLELLRCEKSGGRKPTGG